jgi:hypothetical protein
MAGPDDLYPFAKRRSNSTSKPHWPDADDVSFSRASRTWIASASALDHFRGDVGHPLKDPFNSRFARKIAATMPEKD